MCTTCPHTDPATAFAHEASTGHTVSVWDSPTSQLPRFLWPAQVAHEHVWEWTGETCDWQEKEQCSCGKVRWAG